MSLRLMRRSRCPMDMHPLEAICVEDVPTDQTSDSLSTFERACAYRAHVVVAFVVDWSREIQVVCVWTCVVAEVRQCVQLDVPS